MDIEQSSKTIVKYFMLLFVVAQVAINKRMKYSEPKSASMYACVVKKKTKTNIKNECVFIQNVRDRVTIFLLGSYYSFSQ